MGKEREIRSNSYQIQVTEENQEKGIIEGYAALFNTPSDGLPFEEVIEKGAFDGVIERSDVFALLDHDRARGVLARSKNGNGSLSLIIDEIGLKYRMEPPKTALGEELREGIRRKEITESSFSFDVESDTWEKKSDGTWKRTIHKVNNLYDVAPVYSAAYSKTSVCMRGKEKAEEELKRQEERQKQAELSAYYEEIEKSLNI